MINIVLDTNAYRNIALGLDSETLRLKAREVRAKEAELDYRALASVVVMLELLAHLADPSVPHHDDCVRALAFMANHCRLGDMPDSQIGIVPPGELAVCESLFGQVPDGAEDMLQRVTSLCSAASRAYLSSGEPQTASDGLDLADIAGFVEDRENQFKRDFGCMVSLMDPNGSTTKIDIGDTDVRRGLLDLIRSNQFLLEMAGAWVDRAAGSLGIALGDEQRDLLAREVGDRFQVSLEIYREMVERTVTTGFDIDNPKKKRENSLWDMDIIAIGGKTNSIEGGTLLLVTNEGMIRDAYKDSGVPELVCSLDEYIDRIGA